LAGEGIAGRCFISPKDFTTCGVFNLVLDDVCGKDNINTNDPDWASKARPRGYPEADALVLVGNGTERCILLDAYSPLSIAIACEVPALNPKPSFVLYRNEIGCPVHSISVTDIQHGHMEYVSRFTKSTT
jgi:hypothetical protein